MKQKDKVDYSLFFYPLYPQTIKGIQVLPMTPAIRIKRQEQVSTKFVVP